VTESAWDDSTLIMEALLDIRSRVVRILTILEEDDEEAEEDDA
jgi:hypothetical protein